VGEGGSKKFIPAPPQREAIIRGVGFVRANWKKRNGKGPNGKKSVRPQHKKKE